jgi:hypothetical protein
MPRSLIFFGLFAPFCSVLYRKIQLVAMPTIAFITPEQHAADMKALRAEFLGLLTAYVTTQEEWLPTAAALRTAGIRTRETLVKYHRASAPNTDEPGRITYKKEGTKCWYKRSSCIDYAQRKLGQPALAA